VVGVVLAESLQGVEAAQPDGRLYAAELAQCSRTCAQPPGRAFPQVKTLDFSAGLRHDQSLELSLAHR
jgi:hypothetical protein